MELSIFLVNKEQSTEFRVLDISGNSTLGCRLSDNKRYASFNISGAKETTKIVAPSKRQSIAPVSDAVATGTGDHDPEGTLTPEENSSGTKHGGSRWLNPLPTNASTRQSFRYLIKLDSPTSDY